MCRLKNEKIDDAKDKEEGHEHVSRPVKVKIAEDYSDLV